MLNMLASGAGDGWDLLLVLRLLTEYLSARCSIAFKSLYEIFLLYDQLTMILCSLYSSWRHSEPSLAGLSIAWRNVGSS